MADQSHAEDAQSDFPIVALCASAGGLEAFQAFFKAMPVGSGMAFLVVQHQNPKVESALHTIIQRHTSMPVQLMSEGTSIQPDTIYVLSAGRDVTVEQGQFQLAEFTQRDGWPTTIDKLLQSLAHDAGERVVAVILSGLGTDGTEGVRAIKEQGGRVIAQDPDSATQFPMPRSVIQSDLADVVLAPGEIPAYLLNTFEIDVQPPPELQNPEDIVPEKDLGKVVGRLRHRTGRNFEDYKTSTMRRQIARRIATFPPFIALVGALVLGNAWFPDWLDRLAQSFADMLLPLVTVAVGLQLKLRLVPEYRLPLAIGLLGKLVVLPAGALALGRAMGAESQILDVAVLESAMPPMITAAALASGARLAPQLASAMVAWGVLFSAATVPLWFAALGG